MPMETAKLKLSIAEVSALTGECVVNIQAAIKRGDLKSFLIGRRRAIRPVDVERWLAFLQEQSDKGRPVSYQPHDRRTQEKATAPAQRAKAKKPLRSGARDA